MKSKRIQKCAGFVAVRWMDEHSDGFIYDYQMLVFENNVERDVLGDHRVLVIGISGTAVAKSLQGSGVVG